MPIAEPEPYRPLMIRELDLRLPDFQIERLRLNRHLPEVDLLSEHAHEFTQILCYLSGGGVLSVGEDEIVVGGGGFAVCVPPGAAHTFREADGRRPLCMVLDLHFNRGAPGGPVANRLPRVAVAEIRRELSELSRLRDPNDAGCRLVVSAGVLKILDTLLRALGLVPHRTAHTPGLVRKVESLLHQPGSEFWRISELAAQAGYQSDYLNRVVKESTGHTLREFRDLVLLERAKKLLRQDRMVRDAATAVGIFDQNYFARWFKKLSGVTPSEYRARAR